jgi:hypothetical protein
MTLFEYLQDTYPGKYPQVFTQTDKRRGRCINYRHVIEGLRRKPNSYWHYANKKLNAATICGYNAHLPRLNNKRKKFFQL